MVNTKYIYFIIIICIRGVHVRHCTINNLTDTKTSAEQGKSTVTAVLTGLPNQHLSSDRLAHDLDDLCTYARTIRL